MDHLIFHKPLAVQVDKETLTETYGRFWAQPFERGWGITIGNALRRVLLSSIEGAAIIATKIEGVLHEFSTIPGVKEDVTMIILNLKRIPVRLHSDKMQSLTLIKKGPGTVFSGDIYTPADVEIVDPQIPIATLDVDGSLEMEILVDRGRGYVPGEEIGKESNFPIGYIPIDALYSPVKKVNFQVFPARVGGVTTYDQLVMEIWTNGTISPGVALKRASVLMMEHLAIFQGDYVTSEEELEEEVAAERISKMAEESILEKDIDILELKPHIKKILKANKIEKIKDVVDCSPKQLQSIPKIGPSAVKAIQGALEKMDLTLQEDLS